MKAIYLYICYNLQVSIRYIFYLKSKNKITFKLQKYCKNKLPFNIH